MRRAYDRVLILVGLSVAAAAFWFVALAASPLTGPAAAAVVNRIEVENNQRVDKETIIAYLTIVPGRSFSAEDVDDSLKALFETGLFSDVRIAQRATVLVVIVEENPVINRIVFEGNKKFKDEQLDGFILSRPRGVFTQANVQTDTQRLLELYRRSGRFQASIEPQVIRLSQNRVNLVFNVNEGPETGVSRINFIGNKSFSDGKLRGVISTRQSGLFGWLRSGDTYDPDKLAADEERLRRHYLQQGFADVQIVSTVADLDRERNVFFITFTIDEGERYTFGVIDVDSVVPGVDPGELARVVEAREGRRYDSRRVERSLEAITIELAGSGYAFAQVRPRLERDYDLRIIHVTFVVDEGPRAYIERIDIRGNTRTRDYVIRREFEIAEGDAYNRIMLDRAERRLNGLRYFSEVRIVTEPGSAPDRVNVVVIVAEQATGQFSFGAGYSSNDGLVGDVSVVERNFLGRGYAVRLAVGGGENSRTYEFGFTDPYLLGRRISAGFNVYRREYDANDYRSYDSLSTGGGITFGFPITENFTVQIGYNIEYQEIDVPGATSTATCLALGTVSAGICAAIGDTVISTALYSLIYDSIDNKQDPRDGVYARLSQEFAGVGGDVHYLRTTGTASYYRELLPDRGIVGLLKVQGGNIFGIGESVRVIDAFYKGGETVRGFRPAGIGPRDSATGDSLGGKVFVAGTAEVQFPLPLLPREIGVSGAVFADAGTLFATDSTPTGMLLDDASIRSSVGGSMLWASPLGPIRADFAYVLTAESYDKEQWFRIGGGGRF